MRVLSIAILGAAVCLSLPRGADAHPWDSHRPAEWERWEQESRHDDAFHEIFGDRPQSGRRRARPRGKKAAAKSSGPTATPSPTGPAPAGPAPAAVESAPPAEPPPPPAESPAPAASPSPAGAPAK